MSEPIFSVPDYYVGNFFPANTRPPTSWAMGATFIDQLRLMGSDGEGEKVFVLDTGIDTDHPEFDGKLIESRSFVPGESAEAVNGHGPHCASTAAGKSLTIGVANQAKVGSGKCLSNAGSGNSSWIQSAFDWALAAGATVISVSIGGPGFLEGMEPWFRKAEAMGVVVAVAAGNERQGGGLVRVRSSALVVAAHDRMFRIANFSNPGITPDSIAVAAPGVEIVGAWPGGGYNSISGTSMATPFVAGVCAAFNSARRKLGLPKWKTSDFAQAFSTRAVDAGTPGRDRDFGPGVIDGHLLKNLLIPNPPEVK